ncbi:N-terminal phage integrase SAM-like domain-containing protein [Mycobacteroides abscessus]|uniref:N-terminal phage integrase SAM-like domain-containing protein n=1 Tax=Mycobacteroides abscessus TaxID=36809 RepID=UPI0009416FE7|nr:N-terminal phage integrase SAM-like domain-containing protein [Mycobacteroides abscessus]
MIFREVASAWLGSRHDLKDTTRAAYADALAPTSEHTVKRHKRLVSLRIDNAFGDYPINAITRDDISDWVARMRSAGKKPIRNAYFLVRQVLAQAVADGRLLANPADYVKLPTDHNAGDVRTVDDPAMFLTAAQVAALVAATRWPFSVMVHLAAWSGPPRVRTRGLAGGRCGGAEAVIESQRACKAGGCARRADHRVDRGDRQGDGAQDQRQPLNGPAAAVHDGDAARLPRGPPAPRRPDRPVVPKRAVDAAPAYWRGRPADSESAVPG